MRHLVILPAAVVAAALIGSAPAGAQGEPKVRVLETPSDPGAETVLVGRVDTGEMIIELELGPARELWMPIGDAPRWVIHAPGPDELFHVQVKPVDPRSGTRIPYAAVDFRAINRDTGQMLEGVPHPMWSGDLHYAMNSALLGDGAYRAVVTVGVPRFAHEAGEAERWTTPNEAVFHFRLEAGQLVEVSETTSAPAPGAP